MSATIPSRRGERGGALILAMILLSVLLVAGIAILRVVGRDEVDAAKAGKKQQAQICADAGLQYGRMLFGGGAGLPGTDGATYENSHGWNDFLNDKDPSTYRPGFRYDERLGDKYDLASLPKQVLGMADGVNFSQGADLDGDGNPDFWVSIHDDDDERNLGLQIDDPHRDNNEQVILRSVCIRAGLEWQEGGEVNRASVETILRHVQGASGYGNAQITSNSPDVVGQQ
jgi:hypothetical protein